MSEAPPDDVIVTDGSTLIALALANNLQAKTSWSVLKEKGFDNYLTVLAHLHELGLRPPTADLKAQAAGLDALRQAIGAHPQEAPGDDGRSR